MKRLLLLPFFALLMAWQPAHGQAQTAGTSTYMQIFFAGASWLPGQEVLHYSPAFKGKTGETIVEPDDARLNQSQSPSQPTQSNRIASTVTTERGTFATDGNGKTRQLTDDEIKQRKQQSTDGFANTIQLMEKRGNLARAALAKALNDVAADGWEVVQMTAYGGPGSLVYLLRKR